MIENKWQQQQQHQHKDFYLNVSNNKGGNLVWLCVGSVKAIMIGITTSLYQCCSTHYVSVNRSGLAHLVRAPYCWTAAAFGRTPTWKRITDPESWTGYEWNVWHHVGGPWGYTEDGKKGGRWRHHEAKGRGEDPERRRREQWGGGRVRLSADRNITAASSLTEGQLSAGCSLLSGKAREW